MDIQPLIQEVNEIVSETEALLSRLEADEDLNTGGTGSGSKTPSWTKKLPPALQKIDPLIWYGVGGTVLLLGLGMVFSDNDEE